MALANVKAIRDIVVSDMEADKKEQLLKRQHPAAWRQLLTEVFPALRHSDYRVSYTIRPFSVEEARQLIHTKPQLLSLNEMFLVANTYAPGSQEFNDVFEIAVRMYPQDVTANLNAAITALGKNDLPAAELSRESRREPHSPHSPRRAGCPPQRLRRCRAFLHASQQRRSPSQS